MAFKIFYILIWICLILFTVVKGSCLEYGHSCWGAHGKRSGNNKIFHADTKTPTEIDFTDLNTMKETGNEKNTYDSTEEQLNGPMDNLSSKHDLTKYNDDNLDSSEKTAKFKKLFYKHLTNNNNNNNNGKHFNLERSEHIPEKSLNLPTINERWRRLPLYNIRRLQMANRDNDWLRELEREPQMDEDYI